MLGAAKHVTVTKRNEREHEQRKEPIGSRYFDSHSDHTTGYDATHHPLDPIQNQYHCKA